MTVEINENDANPIKELIDKRKKIVFILGPMVRYSKLPFRNLVMNFGVDVVYTPMILAKEFIRNKTARYFDFSTNKKDRPLIAQVGCNNFNDLLRFVEMIFPYVDGVSLNCGCPIKDQVSEGIGAALMSKPELVFQMIRELKKIYSNRLFFEIKIRIHTDINETISFVKKMEEGGVDMITVHGRTVTTRNSKPSNFEAIKLIKQSVSVPIIANGDCFSLECVYKMHEITKCDGVMSSRGLLANPAFFAGYNKTPWKAVELFWDYSLSYGTKHKIFLYHLTQMLSRIVCKKLIKQMNEQKNMVDLIDWFDNIFDLKRKNEEGFGNQISVPYKHGQIFDSDKI